MSKKLGYATCAGLTLILAGCVPPKNELTLKQQQQLYPRELGISENYRVSIERVSVFKDDLAYGRQRGVYIIYDKQSGKEFIGVSGVGISELGSHQSGKSHHGDER